MKIGPILALGALAYGAYYAYTRREDIKAGYEDLKESAGYISHDLDRINHNLAIIQEQSQVLGQISEDLTYKSRVFQNETQARLKVIQDRLSKYQTEE